MGGAVASAMQAVGSKIGDGAKALYGDEKNYIQTGSPTAPGQDPTMAQNLLFGNQPQGAQQTPAQMLRRNSLAGQ